MHGDPAQSNSSRGAWDRPSQVVEGLLGRWGLAAAHGRTGPWWQRPQERLIGRCAPGSRRFCIKTWPYPPACRQWCWKASGQTTSRRGTQPSSDRPPKATLRSKPPLNTPLHMALFTRRTRPSSTNQWAGTSHSRQEACTRPGANFTQQRADTESRRSCDPAAWGKRTTNTQSQTQSDGRERSSR